LAVKAGPLIELALCVFLFFFVPLTAMPRSSVMKYVCPQVGAKRARSDTSLVKGCFSIWDVPASFA